MSDRHRTRSNRWSDDSTEDVIEGLEKLAELLAEEPGRSSTDISVELLVEAAFRLKTVEMQDNAIKNLGKTLRAVEGMEKLDEEFKRLVEIGIINEDGSLAERHDEGYNDEQ